MTAAGPPTDTRRGWRLLRSVLRGQRRGLALGVLTGVLSLRELLAAPEGARMADVAWPEVRNVTVTADREEVARLIAEYDLVAIPVVDERRRLLGVVTVDDVIDVIQEEQIGRAHV